MNKLVKALERMLSLHELMMEQVNHGSTAYNAECIKEMNEAPGQAREALEEHEQMIAELAEYAEEEDNEE